MKYLKIDNGAAYFRDEDSNYTSIEKITKEDLMELINRVVDDTVCFEMDDFEEKIIQNPAHKIIYSNLYRKFLSLLSDGNRFKDESKSIYLDAKIKYNIN